MPGPASNLLSRTDASAMAQFSMELRELEVVDRTNLSSVRDVIAKRRNSLFGHVVRLDDHTPAHRALSPVAVARIGHRFGPG